MTAALAAALVLPGAAFAAGPGGGGGGGGGAGGGGHDESDTGSLYSDLVVILRDGAGRPILKRYFVPGTPESEPETHFCVQPVSYDPVPGIASQTNPVDGRDIYAIPLQGEQTAPAEVGATSSTEELEPCDPLPEYGMYVHEAELERLNLVRTTEDVIESKIAEFATKWQLATDKTLDPAGRIALDGTAIDASPDYAAIFSKLMKTGGIPITSQLSVSEVSQANLGRADFKYGPFELAAVSIGSAAGKYVPITVDAVEYYNRIVGFTVLDEADEKLPSWEGIDFLQAQEPPADRDDDQGGLSRTPPALPGSEYFVNYGDYTQEGDGPGVNAFSYNRSETFPGSVTWLDVPTLKWQVSRILDVVDYTNLTSYDEDTVDTTTLKGVTAFAQMADDVRATIVYLHENEVVEGFYMDPVGIDTTTLQQNAQVDATVDLKGLPSTIYPGMQFPFSAAMYNPWTGPEDLTDVEMRLTIDAEGPLSTTDLMLGKAPADTESDPTPVTLESDVDGNLTASFPADADFARGYRQVENLLATITPGAPTGEYVFLLELWADPDGDGPESVRLMTNSLGDIADRVEVTVGVQDEALYWNGDVPSMVTQGSVVELPLRAYSPTDGTGQLQLILTGPGDTPPAYTAYPTRVEPRKIAFTEAATHGKKPADVGEEPIPRETVLSTSSAKVYGVTLNEAGEPAGSVAMPLTLENGKLVGLWTTPLLAGQYVDITWYLTVAEFAPLGDYVIDVEMSDVTVPVPEVILDAVPGSVATFSVTNIDALGGVEYQVTKDGEILQSWVPYPGGTVAISTSGDGVYVLEVRAEDSDSGNFSRVIRKRWAVDTTKPVVTVKAVGTLGSSASFEVTADEPATLECKLSSNHEWKSCTSPVSYTNLSAGSYTFSARATDTAGNVSDVATVTWTVTSSGGGGGGVVTPPPTDPTTPADPGDGDPVVPPVDPEEPGDGAGEGGKPDTFIGKGPRSRSFVLGHSVTYRLRSNGDDVQYRVMLNNRFNQLCDSNVCVVDGLRSGKNVLRFAAQADGQRDDTPVVRKIYVPRNADGMKMTKRWTVRKNVRAFEGDLARTNKPGQVIRTRARDIKRIALVVAKGKGNGQVEVYLGQRLLTSTPIDLSNPTNQHQVLAPVTAFRKLQTGFVRVEVVSQGKPVRIEGIGIVNR